MLKFLMCALLALSGEVPVTQPSGDIVVGGSDVGDWESEDSGSVLTTTTGAGTVTWDFHPLVGYRNRADQYDYLKTFCVQEDMEGHCLGWRFEHWVLVGVEYYLVGTGYLWID